MSAEPTTAAVQRFLDALAGDQPAEPIVRALLDRAVCRLHHLCANLLYRSCAGWQRVRALQAEVGALFPQFPSVESANPNAGRRHAPPTAELPHIRGYEVQ